MTNQDRNCTLHIVLVKHSAHCLIIINIYARYFKFLFICSRHTKQTQKRSNLIITLGDLDPNKLEHANMINISATDFQFLKWVLRYRAAPNCNRMDDQGHTINKLSQENHFNEDFLVNEKTSEWL